MRKIILAGLTVSVLGIAAMSPAEARDGCGPHRYRDADGYCRWMRPPPPDYYYDDPPPPPPIFFGFGSGWGGGWHHHWHHW